jgi:hypothetical protein
MTSARRGPTANRQGRAKPKLSPALLCQLRRDVERPGVSHLHGDPLLQGGERPGWRRAAIPAAAALGHLQVAPRRTDPRSRAESPPGCNTATPRSATGVGPGRRAAAGVAAASAAVPRRVPGAAWAQGGTWVQVGSTESRFICRGREQGHLRWEEMPRQPEGWGCGGGDTCSCWALHPAAAGAGRPPPARSPGLINAPITPTRRRAAAPRDSHALAKPNRRQSDRARGRRPERSASGLA